ncbi:ABC transporter ATP-binding protein [Spirochaetia bacterium]|nr:ABC transporter ATP-binding protein [Spirochaetia bacterium]
MSFIQFTGVSLAFGNRDIFTNANIFLKSRSRAALCGANGSGKSTFMKVMAGLIQPDSGERAIEKASHVSYLPQSGVVHSGNTLKEEVETAFSPIKAIICKIDSIHRELETSGGNGSCDVFSEKRTRALLEEQHRLTEVVEKSGYHMRDKKISMVLQGLGFSKNDPDRNTSEFSGGWQMRIALAKILLENPDILLLDEPTNYLDIEARVWFQKWLAGFDGAYLLVSHDRYFLDCCVNEIYELFQGTLKRYAGNYSAYCVVRRQETEAIIAAYKAQQEEIAKAEDLIRRFRYKATKAAMVQERIKKIEKMERIEIPENLKRIAIALPAPPHCGRIALTLQNICKSYNDHQVLSGLDLTVESGERLVVVGPNGAGKTTLLRIIAGADDDYVGTVKTGAGIMIGYFTQDSSEAISGNSSVVEFMENSAPTDLIPKVRDMLGAFLFRGDDVFKSLNVLSGGEKSRLALLKLLLKPLNLLILDEPTNHLDLTTKEILLEALSAYTGTIIFVSHDRAFMEALSTKTLELQPDTPPRLFYGNYSYYLQRVEGGEQNAPNEGKNSPNRLPLPATAPPRSSPAPRSKCACASAQRAPTEVWPSATPTSSAPVTAGTKEAREAEKKKQSLIRRLRREESLQMEKLDQAETEKSNMEADLSKPEIYSNGEKAKDIMRRLENINTTIANLTAEWEKINADLTAVES